MKISKSGIAGFLTAAIITFSIAQTYRVEIFGLFVHPYLMIIPIFAVLFTFNLIDINWRVLLSFIFFIFIFFFSNLSNTNPFNEVLKLASALVTFLFFSKTIENKSDFEFVALGLIICSLIISIRILIISQENEGDRLAGIYAFEGIGNKNAQSLYTLPGLFFKFLLSKSYYG